MQNQQQQQQQSPKTILVKDQNGTTRVAQVPDVASGRAAAAPSYFVNNDSTGLSPAPPADRGLSPVSPNQSATNVSASPAAKVAAESPLLMAMLSGDKGKGQQAGASSGTGQAVSPQQGSIASGKCLTSSHI